MKVTTPIYAETKLTVPASEYNVKVLKTYLGPKLNGKQQNFTAQHTEKQIRLSQEGQLTKQYRIGT